MFVWLIWQSTLKLTVITLMQKLYKVQYYHTGVLLSDLQHCLKEKEITPIKGKDTSV